MNPRDSSLKVLWSLTLETAVAALNMDGVEIERPRETRLMRKVSVTCYSEACLIRPPLYRGHHFSIGHYSKTCLIRPSLNKTTSLYATTVKPV